MEIEVVMRDNGDGDDHKNGDVEKGFGNIGCSTTRGVEGGGGAYLLWEELMVVIPNFGEGPTRRLLNGLNGYASPGRIMAIMGPSGSGKSTLLDSLAGRLSGNIVMTGKVLLNGKKRFSTDGVAYVTQEDVLLGTLTVRETMTYTAHLRLPSNMSDQEKNDAIKNAIMEMGLQDCADTLIGNWHLRGISGGEKKRLSIAQEILAQPFLLFLDEPTSGLDSAAAFFVVQVLRNLARGGRTVVCSIHQPSSEVFAIFDDLCLLSNGETIYFGEAKMAVEFFADSGIPCPTRRNPSDHFLRCINSDFDTVHAALLGSQKAKPAVDKFGDSLMDKAAAETREMLVQKYKYSKYAAMARDRIRHLSAIEVGLAHMARGHKPGWFKQLLTLTSRSVTNMSRDFGYYWLRILVYIAVSFCVGTVFYDVGTNYRAILARGACGGFISGFMTFMSIGGFPSFIEEMKIFNKERLNGHYGVGVFTVSNFISSFPFLTLMSMCSAAITYLLVKFHPGLSHFFYAFLDLLCSIAVVESSMMVVAAIVPNYLMGLIVGAGLIGIMMATAGFFRLLRDLPEAFWRYPISYINYMAWGLQGAYKNDMIGLEFDPLEPGGPKLQGEVVLTNMIGVSLNHSKWLDMGIVIVILISYRLLFFTILKFKERAYPMVQAIYTKRTLHHLSKRPSFRTTPTFPPKRHHIVHSLSSQEGLNSPMHYN